MPSRVVRARTVTRIFARMSRGEKCINKMASIISSTSVVNTSYSVSIPNLRQGPIEHFFESSHESEDDSSGCLQ